jgi:signal transduction histidine kinase
VIEVRHNPVPSGGFVFDLYGLTERKRSDALIAAAHDAAESRLPRPEDGTGQSDHFAHAIAPIELVPQDITRVCLNLIGNGFYAAKKRQREDGDPHFKPTLRVSTRDLGDAVEIRIRDNGTGIPAEINDKLFQPFFTTQADR